jgi:site-specific DNA-methyltransferase (adenine-specific)
LKIVKRRKSGLEINKIYNMDCLEGMKLIPDKSIDMILCDLPYGTTSCKWDVVIPFDKLWQQYERIIKDTSAIVLTASQPFTSFLVVSNPKMFRYEWIWDKRFAANFGVAKIQPLKRHENILVFSKKKSPEYSPQMLDREEPIKIGKNSKNSSDRGMLTKNSLNNPDYDNKTYDQKYPESILLFNVREDKERFHPTQKPVALFEYLIKTYTKEEDLVLDNCMGSGTTAVACINTNRNFIGFELEKKYYDIAVRRVRECGEKN